jgi:hypothetical protein
MFSIPLRVLLSLIGCYHPLLFIASLEIIVKELIYIYIYQ